MILLTETAKIYLSAQDSMVSFHLNVVIGKLIAEMSPGMFSGCCEGVINVGEGVYPKLDRMRNNYRESSIVLKYNFQC